MRGNMWKMLLIFSALLIFAFAGELAAQTITLTPDGQTVLYSRTLVLTASTGSMGDTVRFAILGGAGGSIVADDDTTDASGNVTATFTAGTTDEDVEIVAELIQGSTPVDADTITVDVDPEVLTLTPDGQSIFYGNTLNLTANISSGLSGDTVVFTILGGAGGSVVADDDTTDASGDVTATFTAGTTDEDVEIEAMYIYQGLPLVGDTITVDVDPAPETLTLTPPDRAIVPGESIIINATLEDEDSGPVEDTLVAFSSSGGSLSGSDLTDASGLAVDTLTAGGSTGTITVIASWTDGTITLADTIEVEVVTAPTVFVITPVTATVDVQNDEVTLTVTLTAGGSPAEGLTIDFESLHGLGTVTPASAVTDDDGQTSTVYDAGTAIGVDTVQATWTDEIIRASLTTRAIITINPGSPAKVELTPVVDTVVVTEGATLIAEVQDNYDNHVNATDAGQVSFAAPTGQGTFGTALINTDNNIEVVYTTDDTVTTGDELIATLVATGFPDTSWVVTIGDAPATVNLTLDDSLVEVSDGVYSEDIYVQLLDQYGNPSGYVTPGGDCYVVAYVVSAGGGEFDITGVDQAMVNPAGTDTIIYLSSMTTGVYTITGTSEGVEGTVDITHYPDEPATIVLTPDSAGVPAGADTVFVASTRDQYNNHIPMKDWGYMYGSISFSILDGDGSFDGSEYLEDDSLNWKIRYTSYAYDADTSVIEASWEGVSDEVTLFSAEPGDFTHFMVHVRSDSALVSDGNPDQCNVVQLEAQDANNIRIYTYDNDDTLDLTLTGSAAADSQVTWFIPAPSDDMALAPEPVVGLTAFLAPEAFEDGLSPYIGITNQVAETAQVTVTDTAGHTGTSAGITWLPTEVAAFRVQLEGGVTTINAMDTVNVEVAAIDEFGNPTDVGLPLNVVLSANSGLVQFPTGATQLMIASIVLYPTVVMGATSGLTITVADLYEPTVNGVSGPIEVLPAGITDVPVKWGLSVNLASGNILYQVPAQANVDIKLYNKVGMEVKDLVAGEKAPGFYSESLDALNLSSDIYFVVMKAGDFAKTVKVPVIK